MKSKSAFQTILLAATLAVSIGQAQPPPPPPGGPPPPPPAGSPPPPLPPGAAPAGVFPGGQDMSTRRGTIKAFNSGPEGETNGFILTDGTVVLFPPESGQQMASIVREGSRISFMGYGRPGVTGRLVVNAQSITAHGQTYAMPPDPAGGPGGPPPPPPPPPGGRGRGPQPPPPPPPGGPRP